LHYICTVKFIKKTLKTEKKLLQNYIFSHPGYTLLVGTVDNDPGW